MADQEQRTFKKRESSVFSTIENLNKDLSRILIAGTIISKNKDIFSFLIDDGTGTVNVIMNDVDRFEKVEEGKFVRVFGRIWGEKKDIEIQGDIVQDFSKVDKTLFNQVFH